MLFLPLTRVFSVVFSSRRVGKIHSSSSVPFHASTTHVRQKEERNFCEPLSLIKTQRKGERRAKISPTNFNRLIIIVIEQHNFDEAKKKEKDLHSQSPYYYINAFSALFSL
jgi:hypothetical protein